MSSPTPLDRKSSVPEIRDRFDGDVERFSNLETGQTATIDAALAMSLITEAAVRSTPEIHRVLDIGCGAGNNTIRLRQVYGLLT
jgi:tRNA (cmo5U34)-methyltransferase